MSVIFPGEDNRQTHVGSTMQSLSRRQSSSKPCLDLVFVGSGQSSDRKL